MREKLEVVTPEYSSLKDIFKNVIESGEFLSLMQAHSVISMAWDHMSPQERISLFPEMSKRTSQKQWRDIDNQQFIYGVALIEVFGSYKPPRGSMNMLDLIK